MDLNTFSLVVVASSQLQTDIYNIYSLTALIYSSVDPSTSCTHLPKMKQNSFLLCGIDKFRKAHPTPPWDNFDRPQTKLWEGNVFTPVCQSFYSQGQGVGFPACTGKGEGSASRAVGYLHPGGGDMHPGKRGVCIQGAGRSASMGRGSASGEGWADPPPRYMGYYGIRSTSRRYASYGNAFLFFISWGFLKKVKIVALAPAGSATE